MPKITFFNLLKSEIDETIADFRIVLAKGILLSEQEASITFHFHRLVQLSSKGFPWMKCLQASIHSFQVRMFMN